MKKFLLLACILVSGSYCFVMSPAQAELSTYWWENRGILSPHPYDVTPFATYDPVRKVALFVGVHHDYDGVWLWDGTNYTQTTTNETPAAGTNCIEGIVYDEARSVLLAFIDIHPEDVFTPGETWLWDGSHWRRASTNGPWSRFGFGMTYDSARQRVVLFGGTYSIPSFPAYTYEWDGSVWHTDTNTAAAPPRRVNCMMAYDAKRRESVLFGGSDYGADFTAYGDTWAWNGSRWRLAATNGPGRRDGASMVYDTTRERILLFGGYNYDIANRTCDLWEWDGTNWTDLTASMPYTPPSMDRMAMTYDSARQQAVLFGGYGGIFQAHSFYYEETLLLNLRDVWVDYGYLGTETGYFDTPFQTLGHAVTVAGDGSNIKLKPFNGTEALLINKRLLIQAPLGPVTIRGH